MIKRVLSNYQQMPYCNREIRRKVERHMRKHPGLTFVQAYNQLYKTNYQELFSYDSENTESPNMNGDNSESTATENDI